MTTPPDCPPLASPPPWGLLFALVLLAAALALFGCAAPAPRPLAPLVVAPSRPAPALAPRAGAMKCGGGRCDPVLDPAGFASDPECAFERAYYARPATR